FSSASPSTPDHITSGAYTLTLHIADDASHALGTFVFKGQLGGTISSNSAAVTNTFFSPTTVSEVLGGNTYTVTIGPCTPPVPSTSDHAGAIAAHVDVRAGGGGGGPVSNTPEPPTLMLAGLGLSFVGIGSWCQRRRGKALAVATL